MNRKKKALISTSVNSPRQTGMVYNLLGAVAIGQETDRLRDISCGTEKTCAIIKFSVIPVNLRQDSRQQGRRFTWKVKGPFSRDR
jgi:hypothetical protein